MKRFGLSLFSVLFVVSTLFVCAQDSSDFTAYGNSMPFLTRPRDSEIKNIQVFGVRSGIAYTSDTLYRTVDNGETWYEIPLLRGSGETVSSVYFIDENIGWAVLSEASNLRVLNTQDRGSNWLDAGVSIEERDLADAELTRVDLLFDRERGWLTLPLASSSNFDRQVNYYTKDAGRTWERGNETMENRREDKFETLKRYWEDFRDAFPNNINIVGDVPDETIVRRFGSNPHVGFTVHSTWYLTQSGKCFGFKSGCVLTTKLFLDTSEGKDGHASLSVKEITPPQIKSLALADEQQAIAESTPMFSLPPGGSTRTSLNRGFDKCTAATSSQMQTWWDSSPFYDVNIYIGGSNRGCSQPQLTQSWVNAVSAQGWGFIPTWVGPQAPCSTCATCGKHSADPPTAETEGRTQADLAIVALNGLGLTQGSIVYYDMERYADTGCGDPVKAFLKGWTDRLKEQGYKSGTYGSPFNANIDWINIPQASRMDAVWLARWNNVMSVWGVAPLPDTFWTNHQRIHQWLGPRIETWGGVAFDIDNNISDAPLAGALVPKNKNADFDGDGKTDVSVFRPDTGVWYVLRSSDSVFTGVAFGIGTDIAAPGDYDGDGKTDFAVFRPSDGTWHLLTKAYAYTARQFGSNGDIPVPADFNGDGKTDIAVFRPSNSVWYIWNSDSLGTYTFIQFGLNGDKPVQGDYDGDGKADIAVYRPDGGIWYVLRSSDGGFSATAFGLAADLPAQGDFDGDGKYDLVVYRDGIWYLWQTTAGFLAFQFGLAGDIPATGDYDGDGKADAAVFRPSNGVWYLLRSQSGFYATQFGLTGDKPIPAAYLPQ